MPTEAIVVEVLSPGDRTFQKLRFYAAHGVEELPVLDPAAHTVRLWELAAGAWTPARPAGCSASALRTSPPPSRPWRDNHAITGET